MPNVRSPDMGLEPMTLRLKVWCSTDWANRAPCWCNPESWLVKRVFDWYFDWIVYGLHIKKSLKELFLDLNKSKQIGAVKARCDINLVTFPFSNSSCHFQQTKMQIKKNCFSCIHFDMRDKQSVLNSQQFLPVQNGMRACVYINVDFKTTQSPDMGLEPMTLRLKVWCSTDWANRALGYLW